MLAVHAPRGDRAARWEDAGMAHSERAERLRELLAGREMVVAPFVFDALQAKVAEACGFDAVYMTGFGTAAARGHPDLGLLTLDEMVANARYIARAVRVPLICDADTGYGNPINVWRTVREYESAGAAAILAGKQVIASEEMVSKLRAACEARRGELVIIARTDALAVHGWDEAEARARAYRAAGADLVFVDGIRSRDDLETYASRLADLPRLYNGAVPVADVEKLGFRLMIHAATLLALYDGMRRALRELRETGGIEGGADPSLFVELIQLLGVPEAIEREKRYRADDRQP
jgi:2-methylisocitrate lyase-like PEP mutase family enzyme